MKRKSIVSLLLAAAVISTMLGGCAGETSRKDSEKEQTEGEETTALEDAEEVTLTVLAGQSTTDAGIEDMIDEALAEKYPRLP